MLKMFNRCLALFASVFSFLVLSVPVYAVTPWDDLTAAADLTGLSVAVLAILVILIGITVLYTAARFIKRALSGR